MKAIAFYLPQFHPIPENDAWWGEGFTEWHHVSRGRPLFPGHQQPKLPGRLGFYDLRLEQTRLDQAELARSHGIDAFCYWHYWFGTNDTLLDLPLQSVLESQKPDFPFCLAWGNHSWWDKSRGRLLKEQTYGGAEDYKAHFYHLLPCFQDSRYLKKDGKPVFLLFDYQDVPDIDIFVSTWKELAVKEGLLGVYFIFQTQDWKTASLHGCDGFIQPEGFKIAFDEKSLARSTLKKWNLFQSLKQLLQKTGLLGMYRRNLGLLGVNRVEYSAAITRVLQRDAPDNMYPCVYPGWDSTPRHGKNGLVLHNATPGHFYEHCLETLHWIRQRNVTEDLMFIKSWNEWAEGNYMEPDQLYGTGFLKAFLRARRDSRVDCSL